MKTLLFLLFTGSAIGLQAQDAVVTNAVPASNTASNTVSLTVSNTVSLTEQDAQQLLPDIPREMEGFLHLRERSELQRRKAGNVARAERVFRQTKGGGLFLVTIIRMESPATLEELSPPLHGKETVDDTKNEQSSLKPFLGSPAFYKEIKDRKMSMIQTLQTPTTLVEWRGINISLKDLRPLAKGTGILKPKPNE